MNLLQTFSANRDKVFELGFKDFGIALIDHDYPD
jgi:hypothetical protein